MGKLSADLLTRRALATAAALLQAAANDDRAMMRKILTRTTPAPGTVDVIARIVTEVAPLFGAGVDQILGQSRHREAIEARHVVCYVAHLLGLGYSYTGRQIGRDHSSVMHAVAKVRTTPRLHAVAVTVAERLGWDREEAS